MKLLSNVVNVAILVNRILAVFLFYFFWRNLHLFSSDFSWTTAKEDPMDPHSQVETLVRSDARHEPKAKRIFIPTIGTLGDVKPFLILAKELQKLGYTVCLGVHKRFQDMIRTAGIDIVELGGDMEIILSTTPDGIELRRNPSIFKIGLLKRVYSQSLDEWFSGILSGLKDADLVVLPMGALLPGLNCVENFPNVKAIGIYTFPIVRTREFSPPGLSGKSTSLFGWINSMKWTMFEYAFFGMHNEKINQLRASIDLLPIKCSYDQMIQSVFPKPMKTATLYSKYLLPCPADWQENNSMAGAILDEGHDPFTPPVPLSDFLHKWQNEKIIYIGMGSMMHVLFKTEEQIKFLNDIQRAVESNNCKAILSLVGCQGVDIDQLSNTENVLHLRDNLPHSWLFPKIAAAIHHGGAGTTHTSLQYGLPSLILPLFGDQPFNADRVFVNRLGPRSIPIRQTNERNLTTAIRDLMHENFSIYDSNAKKISQLIRNENGLAHCVQLIESELSS